MPIVSFGVFISLVSAVSCANILAVVPTISKSHYVVFETLIDGLLKRGHRVTAITTFPSEKDVKNLTEISVRSGRRVVLSDFSFSSLTNVPSSFFHSIPFFYDYLREVEAVFTVQGVSDLISSNATFDLVIYEMFEDDVFLGFPHRFKAPVIALGTCYMYPWVSDRFGIPANPAYYPGFYSGYSAKMNIWERLRNTLLDVSGRIFFKYFLEPEITRTVRKSFGSETPPVRDLARNISLYFTNTHFSFYGAQAYPPQVVDISGIHLKSAKSLTQDLEKWMNESSSGVIYFSFGSILRGATLPTQKVKAFVEVFRKLPQRVLWKWEDDALQDLPENVKIMKWLPQRDVLAHPKVRVFISHGGLLGSTEAVVSGVPLLGIPMYGDQPNNVAALVDKGVAIYVDYNNITTTSLSWALQTLLTDTSYSDNVKTLSKRFLDRPLSPLDTAVYWTEYVIRHGGAPHLRSAAVDLTWYQYYLLDVVAVSVTTFGTTFTLVYYVTRFILQLPGFMGSSKLKTT